MPKYNLRRFFIKSRSSQPLIFTMITNLMGLVVLIGFIMGLMGVTIPSYGAASSSEWKTITFSPLYSSQFNISEPMGAVETQLETWSSTDNYTEAGGQFESLGDGHKYQLLQWNSQAELALSPNFSIGVGGSFVSAQSDTPLETRKKSGMNDVFGGLRYRLLTPDNTLQLFAEGVVVLPVTKLDPDGDNVLLGEGATEGKLGLWGVVRGGYFNRPFFSPYVYLGYNTRSGGRAQLFLWKMGAEFRLRFFRLVGELNGFQTISKDKNSTSPTERTNLTDRVNASSLKYDSINPRLFAIKLRAGFFINPTWEGYLGYEKSLNGANQAAGDSIFAGVRISFGNRFRHRRNTIPYRDEADPSYHENNGTGDADNTLSNGGVTYDDGEGDDTRDGDRASNNGKNIYRENNEIDQDIRQESTRGLRQEKAKATKLRKKQFEQKTKKQTQKEKARRQKRQEHLREKNFKMDSENYDESLFED